MGTIAVIGGGIAGLSAAYDLRKDGRNEVILIERSGRLGGKILTNYTDGLVVESGPDSVFTTKPWAVELMEELGLADEFEEPTGSGFSVLVGGKLHAVPRALASLMPAASTALESIGFLGAAARRRIRSENSVAKGSGEDETVASFFRRRFGSRFSKTLAEPLLAGTHAGSAEVLSMKALYPAYIGLEQKYGSLSEVSQATAAIPHNSSSAPHRKPGFLTLRGGLQRLADRLADELSGIDLRLNCQIELIERSSDGRLKVIGPDHLTVDAVVLSLPAFAASPLLKDVAPDACSPLMEIRHASTAVATFAYRKSAFRHELHGNGFLVASDEKADVTGCTFSSLKWRDRAPDDTLLLRAFMGQDRGMNVDCFSDDELAGMARSEMARLLNIDEDPVYTRIDRWTHQMPQYDLGHCGRMDRVEEAIGHLPVFLAGGSYRGAGIPDCIRQGRQAARSILERS